MSFSASQEHLESLLQNMGAGNGSYIFRKGNEEISGSWGIATPQSPFDLASVTKLFTATAILLLWERGQIAMDEPVQKFFPEFRRTDVQVQHLLTHTSSLGVFLSHIRAKDPTPQGIRKAIMEAGRAEEEYLYQDPNMILLAWIVEIVSGNSFIAFVDKEILQPLAMHQTGFYPENPIPTWSHRGGVHDSTAHLMEGVAGHAGLFSSAEDMQRFVRMWREGRGILSEQTMAMALQPSYTSPDGQFAQGLGWKIHAPRMELGMFLQGAAMHGGFTGTFCSFTPDTECVILTDFVYPGERTQEERQQWWHALRKAVQILKN